MGRENIAPGRLKNLFSDKGRQIEWAVLRVRPPFSRIFTLHNFHDFRKIYIIQQHLRRNAAISSILRVHTMVAVVNQTLKLRNVGATRTNILTS